ncbi:uncharacterized protein N0V89_011797 [Didymosphaeria variabile]|uniref:Uncharacterized protein n=1 Tax=Didymosphaeria variabile TaxID=1932322 RepID=A0A9W9C5N8_9PLEO|nr:uncharacterized protein N0V89_011797 [Didymosphaeria variabile]KAJ4345662.1 hypothetical protein N0V89_011797 [Didymosphaeria variabile]
MSSGLPHHPRQAQQLSVPGYKFPRLSYDPNPTRRNPTGTGPPPTTGRTNGTPLGQGSAPTKTAKFARALQPYSIAALVGFLGAAILAGLQPSTSTQSPPRPRLDTIAFDAKAHHSLEEAMRASEGCATFVSDQKHSVALSRLLEELLLTEEGLARTINDHVAPAAEQVLSSPNDCALIGALVVELNMARTMTEDICKKSMSFQEILPKVMETNSKDLVRAEAQCEEHEALARKNALGIFVDYVRNGKLLEDVAEAASNFFHGKNQTREDVQRKDELERDALKHCKEEFVDSEKKAKAYAHRWAMFLNDMTTVCDWPARWNSTSQEQPDCHAGDEDGGIRALWSAFRVHAVAVLDRAT